MKKQKLVGGEITQFSSYPSLEIGKNMKIQQTIVSLKRHAETVAKNVLSQTSMISL